MMTDTPDHTMATVRSMVLALSEFGDVQIMLSRVVGEDTVDFVEGSGNWNTRVQLARAFVQRADEMERLRTEDEFEEDCVDDVDSDDDDDDFLKHVDTDN